MALKELDPDQRTPFGIILGFKGNLPRTCHGWREQSKTLEKVAAALKDHRLNLLPFRGNTGGRNDVEKGLGLG